MPVTKPFDRFIDQRVINFVSRPQVPEACSITALTCVVNYLYSDVSGIYTQEEIAGILDVDLKRVGRDISPGNEDLFEWYEEVVEFLETKGTKRMLLDSDIAADKGFDAAFVGVRKALREERQVVICHRDGHYNLVCGYFESPKRPEYAYYPSEARNEGERWIILADHSHLRVPIYSIRWGQLLREFNKNSNYGLLGFRRK